MLRITFSDIARKHCRDNSLSLTNWLRILTSYKLNTMTPFSFSNDSKRFMMPIGENLVVYKCSRKLVKPRNLNNGKCYKHLPISTINREFIVQIDNKNSSPLFLTPLQELPLTLALNYPVQTNFHQSIKHTQITGYHTSPLKLILLNLNQLNNAKKELKIQKQKNLTFKYYKTLTNIH